MRTKYPGVCHYCRQDVEAGKGDCWNYKGRWFVACDGCKKSNPKQMEANRKHQERQNAKKAKKRQPAPTASEDLLKSLKKDELVQLLLSLSK